MHLPAVTATALMVKNDDVIWESKFTFSVGFFFFPITGIISYFVQLYITCVSLEYLPHTARIKERGSALVKYKKYHLVWVLYCLSTENAGKCKIY